jgi:5-methylcytosine-specific restriction endonuclease McrA
MAKIKNKTHLKNRIIQLLRKLTWSWQPIDDAEKAQKVDKATFECESCKCFVYTGKSIKSHETLIEKYPKKLVKKGTIYHDHIEPVVPIGMKQQEMSYDDLVESMFCDSDNIQILCKECHDDKTKEENERRNSAK